MGFGPVNRARLLGAAHISCSFVARSHIAKSGYGRYFGHGLGHGLGLNVHEAPALRRGCPPCLRFLPRYLQPLVFMLC